MTAVICWPRSAGLALGSARAGPGVRGEGQAVAELCRMAGADEALIPRWIEGGRRWAEAVSHRHSAGQVVHHGDLEARLVLRASGAATNGT